MSLAGAPAHAAFPGINGKIACAGPKDRTAPDPDDVEDYEVYTINPDGTGQVFLTDNPVRNPGDPDSFYNDDDDPTFSPDGRKIAFESLRSGTSELYTMNPDGSGVTRLTSIVGIDTPIGWSADGSRIYLETTRTGNYEVFSINPSGGNPTNLTNLPGATDVGPRGSPDGSKIVFWSNRDRAPGAPQLGGNFEIYSMNADGSGVTRLTNNPTNDLNPDWSPDGRQIVFERAVTGQPTHAQIFRMNADGTGVTQLTNNIAGRNTQPIWSPDGRRIVFNSLRDRPAMVPPPVPTGTNYWEVYTMNATDGSDVRRLTNSLGTDLGCDWQPIPRSAGSPPPRPPTPVYPQPAAPFADCPALTANVIRGTAASNSIVGTPRGDRIFAGTGNDVVDGLAGNDCIDLGPGTDRGQGGDGADLLVGGLGADRMAGSLGNDRLRGGSSGDRLIGGFGNDRLHGQSGADRINGERGRDRVNGGSSSDVISAGSSSDRVSGDQGNDRINGNSGNDLLRGNSGRDRITGSTGVDRIVGGSGGDRIRARDGRRDRVDCGSGRDTVVADRNDRVSGNCERVRR